MSWSCYRSGSEVSTGDGLVATYSIASAQFGNAGLFSFVFTNAYGQATSEEVRVTVVAPPPTVDVDPVSQDLVEGETLTLTAQASGNTPMDWSFQKDSVEVLSGTGLSAQYVKENITLADAGSYTCVFTNPQGSDTSEPAIVTVAAAVSPTVSGVEIINDSGTNTLNPNTSIDLHAVVTYSDNSTISSLDEPEVVTWESDSGAPLNPLSVAMVDRDGVVTPVGIGETTITATTRDQDSNNQTLTDSTMISMVFVEGQYFTLDLGTNNDGRGDDSNIGFNNTVMGAVVSGSFQQDIPLLKAYWNNPNYTYFGTYAVFESNTGDKFYGLDALVWRWEFPDGYTIDYDLAWNGSSYIINSEILFSVWDELLTRKEQTGVNVHILNAPTVAPTITEDLASSLTVPQGDQLSLFAKATGDSPIRWQLRNGTITIFDGVGDTAHYNVLAPTSEDGGFYKFIFTNAAGEVTTTTCSVTIETASLDSST
ncbi:immunoglobulin domain-containing protein [Vibrio owensii]|uniref:immunoglobulin domain-containing protein n=1 Tax=Vibrio owensii TaxID=696485 RepID=UPI0038CED60A